MTATEPEKQGQEQAGSVRIVVRWDVRTLSKNRLPHMKRGYYTYLKNQAHDAAGLAYMIAGRPELDCPVDVRLIIRRSARLDDDGARCGAAACRDRLFNRTKYGTGITPDDSDRWYRENRAIEWQIKREFKCREELEFVVTPRQAEEREEAEVV